MNLVAQQPILFAEALVMLAIQSFYVQISQEITTLFAAQASTIGLANGLSRTESATRLLCGVASTVSKPRCGGDLMTIANCLQAYENDQIMASLS